MRIRASQSVVCILLITASATAQDIWYVDDDGDTQNGCTSWEDACAELQTALSLATAGDQIWVAIGTYKPDYDVATGQHTGDREATFQLISGVGLYGGFDGTEESLEDRAGLFDATILSGDIGGASNTDNSYHVTTANGVSDATHLDGFIMTAGNANATTLPDYAGGGMHNDGGSPSVANCTFKQNSAAWGGGAYNLSGSPAFTECNFIDNATFSPPDEFARGGGMHNRNSDPTLYNCTFSNNSSAVGGGMYSFESTDTLHGCTFEYNFATWGVGWASSYSPQTIIYECTFRNNSTGSGYGGGLRLWNSTLSATDCAFTDNSVGHYGGGIYDQRNEPELDVVMELTNCRFEGNSAERGGGVYSSGIFGSSVLNNCAFVDNRVENYGGGMYSRGDMAALLTNCKFIGNVANDSGGGLLNYESNKTLVNGFFSGNFAVVKGGAMWNILDSNPTLINCTLSNNWTDGLGGGLYNRSESKPSLFNCILWGNSDSSGESESAQVHQAGGSFVVNYSCLQGWTGELGGIGNIGDDPLFANADGEDNIVGTLDDNLRLLPGSPAVDAAFNPILPNDAADLDADGDTNETVPIDLDGNPRFIDILDQPDSGSGVPPIVDMGAYEHTTDCNSNDVPDEVDIAGGTSQDCNQNGIPDECEPSPDCNGNGICDSEDVAGGTSEDCNGNGVPDECEADCNGNGLHDECDIADGTSDDCNGNDVPDECLDDESDCNANSLIDECETADGVSPDLNGNGVPDECEPSILYADGNATGINNGTSWEDAFTDLQDALAVAAGSVGFVEQIWVAAGIYTTAGPGGSDQYATFRLHNGVAVYGGFAGGETSLDERDHQAHVTVLSGDLNGDDAGDFDDISRFDNSYNIVTSTGTDETALLEGFTITAGHTTGMSSVWQDRGGGMWNDGDPTLTNLTFLENYADGDGGGMYNYGSPTMTNCDFTGNATGRWGGGMYSDGHFTDPESVSPILENCTFDVNTAKRGGGLALAIGGTDPTLVNCSFLGNTARDAGGGIYNNNNSILTLINCFFGGNAALHTGWGKGGGMYNYNAIATLINCTFAGNWSAYLWGGLSHVLYGEQTVINCIFWDNSDSNGTDEAAQIFVESTTSSEVDYSCIQGLTGDLGGVGNIGDDPLFVDHDGADNEVGTEDDNLRLSSGSPCIDAADNSAVPEGVETDLDGKPRIVDGDDDGQAVVDMGAYEHLPCPPDFNGDGAVGAADLAMLLGSWGQCEGCPADLDGNGQVGPFDLALLLGAWGPCL